MGGLGLQAGIGRAGMAAPARRTVVLLAGQSNMVGRASFDGGLGYPSHVTQWGRVGADDGVTIAATSPLQHHDPDPGDMGLALQFSLAWASPLVLVPCAKGGASFSGGDWNPGDPLYADAVARTNAAMAQNPGANLIILWHHGESDTTDTTTAGAYTGVLDAMIAGLRADIVTANAATPFVVGGLVPAWVSGGPRNTVQAALENLPARVPHTAFASAQGLTAFDGLHFDAASLRTLGARYAAAVSAAALNIPDTITPTITSAATHSVPNGATTVATLTADEPVTWAIAGGPDAALYEIMGQNTLAFRTAQTLAGSTSVTVSATDSAGNIATQPIIVTVAAAPDTVPDIFVFTDVTDVAVSTVHSDTITVTGINTATPLSIAGGEYRINSGAWTAAPGTVALNDVVAVRVTSSPDAGVAVTATLTIGGVSDDFTVTTAGGAALSVSDFDHFEGATGASSYTFSGVSASGTVVVALVARNGGSHTAVTVGGVAATKLGEGNGDGSVGSQHSSFWLATGVPAGPVTVSATLSTTAARCGGAAWSLSAPVAPADCTFSHTGTGPNGTSLAATVTATAPGLVLAHACGVASNNAISWAGATTRFVGQDISPTFFHAMADDVVTTAGAATVTATYGATSAVRMVSLLAVA